MTTGTGTDTITTMIIGTPTTTTTMRITTTITGTPAAIKTTSTTMGIANDLEADCLSSPWRLTYR
jgi:hypothetical protein